MTVIRTTGLYHVVDNDGPLPFWVEARTYNRAPVVGDEVRVRGFDTLERAERYMHKATRDAVKADKTLKRYLSRDVASTDKTTMPPAPDSSHGNGGAQPRKRGRPAGSKSAPKIDRRRKEHRPVTKEKLIPFSTSGFHLVPEASNPVAQVWMCYTHANGRGRPRGEGTNRYPHTTKECAVTRLVDGKLYIVVDDDNVPTVFPTWIVAEREALYLWDAAPEPKFPKAGTLYYQTGKVEVHLSNLSGTAFTLFDNTTFEWVQRVGKGRSGIPVRYTRLDTAIAEAEAYAHRVVESPAARLISVLWESEEDRLERELREEISMAAHRRAEEARARAFEDDQRELAAIAARNAERVKQRGRRPATQDEIAQAKRLLNSNTTTKPTREQRLQATRSMQAPRALKDQRREGDE